MTIFLPTASARLQAFPFSVLPVTSGALSPTFGCAAAGVGWAETRVAVSKRLATMETAVSDVAFMVRSIGCGFEVVKFRNVRNSFLDMTGAYQLEGEAGLLVASLGREPEQDAFVLGLGFFDLRLVTSLR